MQLFSRNKAIVALSLGALALGACGDDVTVPVAPLAPVVISITPPSALMNVGESVNFAVQISGGSTSSVPTLASCSSSAATVATATVAGSSCRVTAIAAGNATITAAASTGQVTAASVAVAAPAPAITALAVSPSAAQLAVGSSLTVVPTVNRANAAVTVVYTYTSSTAAVATVSAAGMVTAVAPGTTTITVSAAGTGTGFAPATMTTAATITVSDRAPGLTALQVSPASAALTVGGTQSVTASAQGPRAAAATMTYGTSAPAIATVSATGVITAVAAGTATITVTAQSTQDGAFAASSLTGLVTVTVSNLAVVSISLAAVLQGPMVSSYTVGTNSAGITSATNAQAGQAVDVTNVRDQIQLTATLNPNGQRVDSVVAFIANADGSIRTAAAQQSFSGGAAASGNLTFVINTADFTADFTAGTAAVKFANGPRQISVSAFSGTAEQRSTNSQTLVFNNVDGYAARLTAPKSVISAAGLTWHGGPDSLTASLGSTTVVPVYYTAGRTLARATLSMREGALGDTQVCTTARNNLTAAPFKATFGGAAASAGDTTLVNCAAIENGLDHVIGVTGATDGAGAPAPSTTYAAGFRYSTTAPAPSAIRLDFKSPTAVAIRAVTAWPGDSNSTWIGTGYSMADSTAVSTDAGVGMPGTTGKSGRTWQWYSCGGVLSTAPTTFSGNSTDLVECATNTSASAYTLRYLDEDRLGNKVTSGTKSIGIDKTLPVITWDVADEQVGTAAVTFTPSVVDGRSGILDSGAAGGYVARQLANGVAYTAPSGRSCENLANNAVNISSVTYYSSGASNTMACSLSSTYKELQYATTAPLTNTVGTGATATKAMPAKTISTGSLGFYVAAVVDKAGNRATSTRKAIADNVAPTDITAGITSVIAASSNPTITVSYKDLRPAFAWAGLTYGSNIYRYSATTQNSAFGGTFNQTIGSSNSAGTATAITAARVAPAISTASPFVIGVTNSVSTGAVTKLSAVSANVFDFGGNTAASAGADAIGPDVVPTLLPLTTSDGTLSVLTSLAAANDAPAGLKAVFTRASGLNTGLAISRVDFYRETATAATYDYVGSATSPVASTAANQLPQHTFTLTTLAATGPTGVATVAPSAGDKIVAIGVRSNGLGTVTNAAIVGGAFVSFTLSGLPTAVSVPVAVTSTNGFTTTITAGNGKTKVPVTLDGTYIVTFPVYSPVDGGSYNPTRGSDNSIVVAGNGEFASVSGGGANAYVLNKIWALVGVTGLPAAAATSLTFALSGQASVVVNPVYVGSSQKFGLPALGTWSITSGNSVAYQGITYRNVNAAPTGTLASASIGAVTLTVTAGALAEFAANDLIVVGNQIVATVTSASGATPTLVVPATTVAIASGASFKIIKAVMPTRTVAITAPSANGTAASADFDFLGTTPNITVTATTPTGITLTPAFAFDTSSSLYPVTGTATSAWSALAATSAAKIITFANSILAAVIVKPVAQVVDGISYGAANQSLTAVIGTSASVSGSNATFAYNAAKVAVVFVDSVGFTGGLADLATTPITIKLTNGVADTISLGALQPVNNTAAINTAAPTVGFKLPVARTLAPVCTATTATTCTIGTITAGADVYKLVVDLIANGSGNRMYNYGANATVLKIHIKKN